MNISHDRRMPQNNILELGRAFGVAKDGAFLQQVGFRIEDRQVGIKSDQPLVTVGFTKLAHSSLVDIWNAINSLTGKMYKRQTLDVAALKELAFAEYKGTQNCPMSITIHTGTSGYNVTAAEKHLAHDKLAMEKAWGAVLVTAHALYRLRYAFPIIPEMVGTKYDYGDLFQYVARTALVDANYISVRCRDAVVGSTELGLVIDADKTASGIALRSDFAAGA